MAERPRRRNAHKSVKKMCKTDKSGQPIVLCERLSPADISYQKRQLRSTTFSSKNCSLASDGGSLLTEASFSPQLFESDKSDNEKFMAKKKRNKRPLKDIKNIPAKKSVQKRKVAKTKEIITKEIENLPNFSSFENDEFIIEVEEVGSKSIAIASKRHNTSIHSSTCTHGSTSTPNLITNRVSKLKRTVVFEEPVVCINSSPSDNQGEELNVSNISHVELDEDHVISRNQDCVAIDNEFSPPLNQSVTVRRPKNKYERNKTSHGFEPPTPVYALRSYSSFGVDVTDYDSVSELHEDYSENTDAINVSDETNSLTNERSITHFTSRLSELKLDSSHPSAITIDSSESSVTCDTSYIDTSDAIYNKYDQSRSLFEQSIDFATQLDSIVEEENEGSGHEEDILEEESDLLGIIDEEDEVTHHTETSRRKSKQLSFYEHLTNASMYEDEATVSHEEKALQLCDQTEPEEFSYCIPPKMMSKCVKIGEGCFGEVFRSQSTKSKDDSVALKIMPIEGNLIVNDCPQKKFEEIIPEMVIARALSDLSLGENNMCENFCKVNRISIAQGVFPDPLLKEWDVYNKRKNSENDRPDMYADKQLFVVFEFGDAGSALEHFKFSNHAEAVSVLQQVIFALAVAEETLEFEHRDLHVGNVLVRRCKQKEIPVTLLGRRINLQSKGVFATIIDFTNSRVKKDECAVFCDLSTDEDLFSGQGDIQFQVYRDMKSGNSNDWETYHPYTNILWVNYLCEKLSTVIKYKETGRGFRNSQRLLRHLKKSIPDYNSCGELAMDDSLWESS